MKVLHILPGLNICGGIESYVMNYYRHINRNEIQFDFIVHDIPKLSYQDEIEKMGGNIKRLPPINFKNLKETAGSIDDYFDAHREYTIVHCHMANAAFLYLKSAKNHGVPVRILHSHQTKYADKKSHAVRNIPLIKVGKQYANVFFACSEAAGDFLYRKKPYSVIRNAIEADRFAFNSLERSRVRDKLGVQDQFIVGNVGRLTEQKNQVFLLKLFREILYERKEAQLWIIGSGELERELKSQAKQLGLGSHVVFMGSRIDVNRLYQAMDCFVLPSLYEGLPVVLVEAQAAGLPCVVSSEITSEAKLTEEVTYLNLDAPLSEWAETVLRAAENRAGRKNRIKELEDTGYSIPSAADRLSQIYYELVESNLDL